MNSEKATLHDFSRMCKKRKDCKGCKLSVDVNELHIACFDLLANYPDKASEIILKWCKEHPIKTRQSELLKIFPNAKIALDGALSICPRFVNKDFSCPTPERRCSDCFKEYWLAEVEERHDL